MEIRKQNIVAKLVNARSGIAWKPVFSNVKFACHGKTFQQKVWEKDGRIIVTKLHIFVGHDLAKYVILLKLDVAVNPRQPFFYSTNEIFSYALDYSS